MRLTVIALAILAVLGACQQTAVVAPAPSPFPSQAFKQGNFIQTDRALDIVLYGPGYYVVDASDGNPGYLRCGALRIGAARMLESVGGQRLRPPIEIPEDAINLAITAEQVVTVKVGKNIRKVGTIVLVDFPNRKALRMDADGVFRATPEAGSPSKPSSTTIWQNMLEAGCPGTEGR